MSDVDEPVTKVVIWYPFWVYTVKLRYKLLSELGEISHFILKTLDDDLLTMSNLREVMGLSSNQLHPIVKRMTGLGLLKDQAITTHGRTLAHIAKHIHEKELSLAIDRHYHPKYSSLDMLLIPGDSADLEVIPSEALKIPYPQARHIIPEDCFFQTERFRREIRELGPRLIPEFEEVLPFLGKHDTSDWDVEIRLQSKDKGLCHHLLVKPYSEPVENYQTHLTLTSPVLLLTTQFKKAEGVMWDDPASETPNPLLSIYSAIEETTYDDNYTVAIPENENLLSFLEEPLISNTRLAKGLLEHTNSKITDEYQFLSRQHVFSELRQLHQYSYQELIENMTHVDILRIGQ